MSRLVVQVQVHHVGCCMKWVVQVREQHQDERGERDEVDQDVCERRDEENERGRDGGGENESVRAAAIRAWDRLGQGVAPPTGSFL